MNNSFIQQTALISESDRVGFEELSIVSAALQKQAMRDIAPIWNIAATVDPFVTLEDVPPGYWPMIIMDDIGFDGAAGIHLDKDGQPFALISSSVDLDEWSLTASHELVEMLVDPFGDRLVAGDSPKPDQGRVLFLVEVADPSEAAEFGYSSNGVLVSDFYTPRFFDPIASVGVRYSFTDAIEEPRQVLPGGYLSWLDPESGEWWQEIWFNKSASQSSFRNLGALTVANGSFRSQIDRITGQETHSSMASARSVAVAAGLTSAKVKKSSTARAHRLREQIDIILEGSVTKVSSSHRRSSSRRGARRSR